MKLNKAELRELVGLVLNRIKLLESSKWETSDDAKRVHDILCYDILVSKLVAQLDEKE